MQRNVRMNFGSDRQSCLCAFAFLRARILRSVLWHFLFRDEVSDYYKMVFGPPAKILPSSPIRYSMIMTAGICVMSRGVADQCQMDDRTESMANRWYEPPQKYSDSF